MPTSKSTTTTGESKTKIANDPTRKRYLGYSVYVETENGMLKLTTDNGYENDPRNVIYLNHEVFDALCTYAKGP